MFTAKINKKKHVTNTEYSNKETKNNNTQSSTETTGRLSNRLKTVLKLI